jgi:hypothetical protein
MLTPTWKTPFIKLALLSVSGLVLAGSMAAPAMADPAAVVQPWNSPDAATELFETPDFLIRLQSTSQTLVALAPKGQGGFDFAPSGRFTQRLGDGNYRLGDIDLRIRPVGADAWQDYSSAFKRAPVKALKVKGVLASADITPSLNGIPLKVSRTWRLDKGQLALSFTLSNPGKDAIEIGGLGLPMIFDNIITNRTLDEAHEQASFYDPYVGRDAGYLQVTRLNGHGPALLVLPEKNTPFELYKPILDRTNRDHTPVIYNDPMRRGMVFEGFYDWMVASKGFADTDWKGVQQWNETTSLILKPGETRTFGLRFVLSPSIRAIEDTLAANKRPVAVGLPGYVLPTDLPADLFLKAPSAVKSIEVFPVGAVDIGTQQKAKTGWIKYVLTGKTTGRARITVTYADGQVQTVHYLVTKPEQQVVADMGHFLTTKQWFDDPKDPFHRGPSIMTYDRDEQKIVTDDPRVWVSGLSDEGGAGPYLATIMKELDNPTSDEVAKFEIFANQTLWGKIQVADGEHRYGVHKSIFYYEPKLMPEGTYDPKKDWSTWTSWNKQGADDLGRSFNYVHVAASWWTLYRLARYHEGMATQENWQTYLTRAESTVEAMMRDAPYYTQFGQMEGNVFLSILTDLRREGMTEKADTIEALMKGRADHWATEKYPFGSEMPWDSTGQPEVYEWLKYFHHDDQAASTREVILAYDPTLPHWGYNGSARRFWDFLYAGKKSRIERQLHHYGSSNNALPLFDSYRENPKDFHLLRVAYGGLMGSLSNIDDNGFGSAAFHSFPDTMNFDAITGDYGMSFFAHAYSAASYLANDPTFGWVGFGGVVTQANGKVTLAPKDSARTRLFVAPAGLWLTLDAGKVRSLAYDPKTGRVDLTLEPADAHTPAAYVNLATTTKDGKPYAPVTPLTQDKGAFAVTLGAVPQTVSFAPSSSR